jgi:hypothetical protein
MPAFFPFVSRYKYIDGPLNPDLQQLLTATILKDLPKLLCLLKEQLHKKFGDDDKLCFSKN